MILGTFLYIFLRLVLCINICLCIYRPKICMLLIAAQATIIHCKLKMELCSWLSNYDIC